MVRVAPPTRISSLGPWAASRDQAPVFSTFSGIIDPMSHRRVARVPEADRVDRRGCDGYRQPPGRAITAALFLKEFVGDSPWAHMDIAGTG